MSQGSELERLEQFVTKLLSQYDRLLEKNTQLQAMLRDREEEVRGLQSQLAQADTERGNISGRIKGLIDQIEHWQAAVDEPEEPVTAEEPGGSAPEVEAQGEMFADEGDDDDEIDREVRDERDALESRGEFERESSLQRNLFNMETTQFRHNSSD